MYAKWCNSVDEVGLSTNIVEELIWTAWTRVRHVPAGNTWHPAKDQLDGTEEYGSPSDDTTAWSIKWDKS